MKINCLNIKVLLLLACMLACSEKKTKESSSNMSPIPGTFGFDLAFMQSQGSVLVLGTGPSKVLVVPAYQGRVMTSTANGDAGNSYGWINYDLIRSGELKPHMNPFGGEDRFWIGPEGGQFALFFQKGNPFDFEHWQTPAVIDTEPFDLVSSDSLQATFKKSTTLTNFLGTTFQTDIHRQIRLLTKADLEQEFGITLNKSSAVAFQSVNTVINAGKVPWLKKNGLLSIWILGMFNPAKETMIVLPHDTPDASNKVADDYFGTIPADRIVKTDNLLLLKGDGIYRGKVGIPPAIAKNIAGSYDAEKHILTLVKFDLDRAGDYVNSKWEMQKAPFSGDAVNAYNDGPVANGSQLGPFYELESSSPARELKPGEGITHRSITVHFEGDESELDEIAEKTLGVGLKKILFPK